MAVRPSGRKFFPALALATSSLIFINIGGPSAEAITRSAAGSPSQQIVKAYNSASGIQVRAKLATLIADPALPQAAHALLKSDGPAGSNSLTAFQSDLLNALITATKDPALLSAMLSGTAADGNAWLKRLRLRSQLLGNPAVRVLDRTGSQLKHAAELPADISAGAAGSQTTYTTLTPPPTANQGGSAALDTVIGDFAGLRTSSDFNDYAGQLGPVLANPSFQNLVKDQPPLTVASFLPTTEAMALRTPADPYRIFTASLLDDIRITTLEILVPIALFVIGLIYLPVEIPAALAIATLVGAIYTGTQVAQGVIDLANDLDCDHDGDPFDPADAPGQEC
jgi:hypothetical protein